MRRSARPVVIGGLLIAAVLGLLLYQSLSSNLVYYITPTELKAQGSGADGRSFRLGGQVRPGSVRWEAGRRGVRFVLQDPRNAVSVSSQGSPPQLFRAGSGVVVEGSYANGVLAATTLMIKHGSDYRVPKPGQTPKPDGAYRNSP